MSKLTDLIKQLCPNGVNCYPLWEVTIWDKKFTAVKKEKQEKTIKYHYFLADDLKPIIDPTGDVKILTTNITDLYTRESLVEGYISTGEIVCIPWGGNAVVQYYKGDFVTADNRIATSKDTNKLRNKYLYYFMCSKIHEIKSFYRGSGIKHPAMAKVLELEIPIPPIEVQDEVVRVLDLFAELNEGLSVEIEIRTRQFGAYRDTVIEKWSKNENTEHKSLGSISTIVRGASPRPIQKYLTDDENGVPWIKIGDVSSTDKYITNTAQKITVEGSKSSRFIHPGYFVLSNSMSFGRPYISKITGCIHDGWLAISDFEDEITSDYLYHILSSNALQKQMAQRANNGAMKNLNADIVKALEIPVPPIEVQNKIVKALDTFIELNESLQQEFDLRMQQFEYYRDKLLAFNRRDANE